MKQQLLAAFLGLGSLAAVAQGTASTDYAAPAKRSTVVAVEFTGQLCRYCPNMSRALEDRERENGRDRYIIAAMHSLEDYSVLPSPHVSLYNAEAGLYAESIEVHTGLPHLAYDSLGPTLSDLVLTDKYKTDDLLECTGSAIADVTKKEYEIKVKTRLRSNRRDFVQGKTIDILFWALENNIVALQDDNGSWTYPAHKNIFRGSINGTWGKEYQIGSELHVSLPIPQGVSVVENTEVIVLFLDHDTRTILDSERLAVSIGQSGVENIKSTTAESTAPIYDIYGRQVTDPVKGNIYIRGNQKFIAK